MTEQQLNELKTSYAGQQLRRAMFFMNLSYVLADTINSYMVEANAAIGKIGQTLTQENKRRFNRLLKMLKDAFFASKAISKEIYHIPSENEACEDSDFLYEAVILLARKTGNSRDAQQQMLDHLRQLPDVNTEIVEPE